MANITSPNRRFIIAKNLIMMLVVLVVGLLAVWSWFTVNRVVTANKINVQAAFPNEIGLAKVRYDGNGNDIGPDVFSGQIDFENDVILTKDCTGDGETLINPSFSVIKDKAAAIKVGREVNSGGKWEEALSNVEVEKIRNVNPDFAEEPRYIEHEFYVRSKTKSVSLSSGSYLATLDNNESFSSSTRGSSYGNFSSDAIVGATRVSLLARGAYVTQTIVNQTDPNSNQTIPVVQNSTVEWTNSNPDTSKNTNQRHLVCLWLPRPDIKLNPDPNNNSSTTDWTITNGITANDPPLAPTAQSDNDITYFHFFYLPTSAGTAKTPAYTAKWYDTATAQANSYSNTQYTIPKNEGVVVQKHTAGDDEHFVVTSSSTVQADSCPTLGKDFKVAKVSEDDYLRTSSLRRNPLENGSDTSYYVYKYTLRIWLEGEDSESRRAMDGGQFRLHLEFK